MLMTELETYQGRNPRPDDFDAFWDRGLAEMAALDPQVELVPAGFDTPFAECLDMTFTGVGGARIHAQLLRPRNVTGPHPAIVMFHGYSRSAGDWIDKLGYVAMGYTVAALDCRGQGGQSEDCGGVKGNTLQGHIIRGLDGPPDKLLFRQIFLDTAQLAGLVMDMPDVDEHRVGATGESQGGGLTLACAALEPRIKLVAPIYPYLCDYRRLWEMDKDEASELRRYFRAFDPRHERVEDTFVKLGYIDVQFLTPRIRGEVNMAVSLLDTVCPLPTQFAAYNKIEAKKSLTLYPDFGHEPLPGIADTIFQFMTRL